MRISFKDTASKWRGDRLHRAVVRALVFVFAATQSPAETTIYVGKHFEVRDHDAPVKYVFNGSTRVARITGSLSANERIQRLRLRADWNLVSLAVAAPDFLDQLQELTSGPAPVIQALYRWQPATSDHRSVAPGEGVAAGTGLWVSAKADAIVAVRGGYVEPSQWGVPPGGTFIAMPALEVQSLTVPAGASVWRYDAPSRRWQIGLNEDLGSLSDLPLGLVPCRQLLCAIDFPFKSPNRCKVQTTAKSPPWLRDIPVPRTSFVHPGTGNRLRCSWPSIAGNRSQEIMKRSYPAKTWRQFRL